MKKRVVLIVSCLLLCVMTGTALANSWGAKGGILEIVSGVKTYNEYSVDAQSGVEKVQGRTVDHAVMSSRYHSQLIAAVQQGKKWKAEALSTTAVYQPGDERGKKPALAHTQDGFTLIYDDREIYTFVQVEGTYYLMDVRFDAPSDYGDSLQWEGNGYIFWASGLGDKWEPIGDAMWVTDPVTLEEFHISRIPRSMDDVRRMNAVADALTDAGAGRVQAQETWEAVKNSRKLAVYSAPDEGSYRASKGKASVSTGGSMALLGGYQGWTMISYEVSVRTSRIGFVHSSLMSADMELPLAESPVTLVTARNTILTDDPDVSEFAQFTLPAGTQVQGLALYGDFYALVECVQEGQRVWGFVPLCDLALPEDGIRWDVMDLLVGKWNYAGGSDQGTLLHVLYSDGSCGGGYALSWRVVDCAPGAEYAEPVELEVIFTLPGRRQERYGLLMHEDCSISLMERDSGAWYVRYEYSTFGNG